MSATYPDTATYHFKLGIPCVANAETDHDACESRGSRQNEGNKSRECVIRCDMPTWNEGATVLRVQSSVGHSGAQRVHCAPTRLAFCGRSLSWTCWQLIALELT